MFLIFSTFFTLSFFLDEIQNDITHSKDKKCFLDISNFNKLHIYTKSIHCGELSILLFILYTITREKFIDYFHFKRG